MNQHLISLMVLLPFVGSIVQAFLPATRNAAGGSGASASVSATSGGRESSRWVALGSSVLASLCAVVLVASLTTPNAELQATETLQWVGSYAIAYEMGIDGLNALLVLLVAIVFPILIAYEWNQKMGARGMHALFLLLQSAFFGAVCAQDLFLQFFFWALSAVPFYFLIGIWGGEDREAAAFRSVVSGIVGNALFFAALIVIYYSMDPHTFSFRELSGGKLAAKMITLGNRDVSVPVIAFLLISAGLVLRVPVWPFHGWFTQVAEQSPPSVLVALSGVTVPVAVYLFVRLSYSLFPETVLAASPGIVFVGALNLLIGSICAIGQRGLRSLLAYVSVGQVGLLLLGIGSLSSSGLVGAIYQQLILGLALAGFGLLSGLVIERTGKSLFLGDDGPLFRGVAGRAPAIAVIGGIVLASLLGFPGLGGFVGGALVIIGGFAGHQFAVLVAGVAMLLAAYGLFMMYRYVFLGKPNGLPEVFPDLSLRERVYLFPLVAGLLAFGLYPKPLLDLIRPTVVTLLSTVK